MKKFRLLASAALVISAISFGQTSKPREAKDAADRLDPNTPHRRYKMKDLEKSNSNNPSSFQRYLETTALFGVLLFSPHMGFSFSTGGSNVTVNKSGGSKSTGSK